MSVIKRDNIFDGPNTNNKHFFGWRLIWADDKFVDSGK